MFGYTAMFTVYYSYWVTHTPCGIENISLGLGLK